MAMENTFTKKPELLSPAGDCERLEMAVRYGADAVYLGGKAFGMRSSAPGFSDIQLHRAVEYAHKNGVKVYLTCNIVPNNEEASRFPEFLRVAVSAGVDALILADIGLMELAKKYAPHIPIHASTQVGIMNYQTANALYHLGASRVVLARELSLEDIRFIRKNTPSDLELECFVHGAVCVSFSGRCLLSQYMTGRDANRGNCAQPCRWEYSLYEKSSQTEFNIVQENEGTYILNASDLCLIEHLQALAEAGVNSFKIEGRAKSFYYVAMITNAYRMVMNQTFDEYSKQQIPKWVFQEVHNVSHRSYHTGFLFGRPSHGQNTQNGGYIRTYDVVAVVERSDEAFVYCSQRNKFCIGDALELVQPGIPPERLKIFKMYNEKHELIQTANHAKMSFYFPCNRKFPQGSIIRRKV